MVSEANAMVSTGNINELADLAKVKRFVGGNRFRKLAVSPNGALRIPFNMIPGATNQIGGTRTTTAIY
jgi:hypothetical protein